MDYWIYNPNDNWSITDFEEETSNISESIFHSKGNKYFHDGSDIIDVI